MYGVRNVEIDPLVPAAFTDAAAIKSFLDISEATYDALLGTLAAYASHAIELYCDRLFASRTVTETMIPEDAVRNLVLAHAPMLTLTTLHVDDVAQDAADLYVMKAEGMLRRKDGGTIGAPGQAIVAVYTAGYASTPPAVVQATKEFVRDAFAARKRDGSISRQSVVDVGEVDFGRAGSAGSMTSNGVSVPASVAIILEPYVRRYAA